MYDVVPIIALAQFKYEKNIYAYNHADHLYWVGSSILSATFEMSTDGMNFSQSRRGIINSLLLPVPLEKKKAIQTNLKEVLGMPSNVKVVLTIGSEDRFITNDYSYIDMVKEVFSKRADIYFLIVGKHSRAHWKELWGHPKIKFVGLIPKEQLGEYYSIADIYVDSFPMGGGTSTLDAISYQIPIIKVKHMFFEFDSLKPFVLEKQYVADKIIELLFFVKEFNFKNISEHFNDYFNEVVSEIDRNKYLRSTCFDKYSKYDLSLMNYQEMKKTNLINSTINKCNSVIKVKYLIRLMFSLERFMKLLFRMDKIV